MKWSGCVIWWWSHMNMNINNFWNLWNFIRIQTLQAGQEMINIVGMLHSWWTIRHFLTLLIWILMLYNGVNEVRTIRAKLHCSVTSKERIPARRFNKWLPGQNSIEDREFLGKTFYDKNSSFKRWIFQMI